jgi:hypothetical protein
MEDNYTVLCKVHSKENDLWGTQVTWNGSDPREAKKMFHSEFVRLLEDDSYDYIMVLLTSAWGSTISDFYDERERKDPIIQSAEEIIQEASEEHTNDDE